MKIHVDNFRGELPRIATHLLPNNYAQATQGPRLLGGKVEPWFDWQTAATTSQFLPINTIYYLEGQYWLAWSQSDLQFGASQVDVARSAEASNNNGRIFFTGTDMPRYTNIPLATTGSGAFPIASMPLGVCPPVNAPTVSLAGTSAASTTYTENFSTTTGWTVATPSSIQTGVPRLDLLPTPAVSALSYAYKTFNRKSGQFITVDFDFTIHAVDNNGVATFECILSSTSTGQGTRVGLTKIAGTWYMTVISANNFQDLGAISQQFAFNTPPSTGVQYHCSITLSGATGSSYSAFAQITNGATVLASASFAAASAGDVFGFGATQNGTVFGQEEIYVNNLVIVTNPSIPAINVTDNFAQNNGWSFYNNPGVVGGGVHGGNQGLFAAINSTLAGAIAKSLFIEATNTYQMVWANRAMQVDQSLSITTAIDFNFQGSGADNIADFDFYIGLVNPSWQGAALRISQLNDTDGTLTSHLQGQVGNISGSNIVPTISQSEFFPPGTTFLTPNTWYTLTITINKGSTAASVNVVIAVRGGAQVGTISFSSPEFNGSYGNLVIGDTNAFDPGFRAWFTNFQNLSVQATAAPTGTAQEATSYVYTFLNSIGEESAPSPASATIIRQNGSVVSVNTDTVTPQTPVFDVQTKNIYRSATTSTGTFFFFLANVPLSQQNYLDSLSDTQLGQALPSLNWDLPPSDMRGIVALPNGGYAGFSPSTNQLCFSVLGIPHAWPVIYRIGVDYPIVTIGSVDSAVVAATTKFPYIALGTQPGNYTLQKIEIEQGCVAPRSGAYMKGVGFIYATNDGLCAVVGPGRVDIITSPFFTKKEWQGLVPANIIGRTYDDRYYAFCGDPVASPQGFIMEFGQGGFGKVTLTDFGTALYTYAQTDTLYAVLQTGSPPPGTLALLHMDGTNGSTSFPDVYGNTWAVTGAGPAVETAQVQFGTGAAGNFNNGGASTAGIGVTNPMPVFGFGVRDFTIEGWIYPTALPVGAGNNSSIFRQQYDSNLSLTIPVSAACSFMIDPNGKLNGYFRDTNFFFNQTLIANNAVTLNTWQHVALVRHNGVVTIYMGGVSQGTINFPYNITPNQQPAMQIGCYKSTTDGSQNQPFLGYIDEFRISLVARYTANFTPPTGPFTQ